MGTKPVKDAARMGQVFIEVDGEQRFVKGRIYEDKGVPLQNILDRLDQEKGTDESLDYFVFVRPSPNRSQSSVFVMVTEANAFDAEGKKLTARLFESSKIGTLEEVPGSSYIAMVDNKWLSKLEQIDVTIVKPEGQELTAAEKKLHDSLIELSSGMLKGTVVNHSELASAKWKLEQELGALGWDVELSFPEVIDQTDGKPGEKALKLDIAVVPAAASLDISGLPESLRSDAIKELNAVMQRAFEDHPAVAEYYFGKVLKDPPKLIMEYRNGVLTWKYPPDIPDLSGESLYGAIFTKSRDLFPDVVSGSTMPIPGIVRELFKEWIGPKLKSEKGKLKLEGIGVPENGVARANFKKSGENYIILPETVEQIKSMFGIDLSSESEKFAKGNADWSEEKLKGFMTGIENKFKEKGIEFDEETPGFKTAYDGGIVTLNFSGLKRLTDPSLIRFMGETDLPGIGGEKTLRDIIGSERLTGKELNDRLLKIEDLYHKAGYLIKGENLQSEKRESSEDGVQIKLYPSDDGSAVLEIVVARSGTIKVDGNLPKLSKNALEDGIATPEGEPFNIHTFRRKYFNSLRTLKLLPEEEPVFVKRDDKLDVIIKAASPQDNGFAQVGANSMSVSAAAMWSFFHDVPGTSDITAGGGIERTFTPNDVLESSELVRRYNQYAKRLSYRAGVSATTLPINDQGVYLSGGASYDEFPYMYRDENGDIRQMGRGYRTSGSVMSHIPLGEEGIGGPWELRAGVDGTKVHQRGEEVSDAGANDGRAVNRTTYRVGEEVGLKMSRREQVFERDALVADASVRSDQNLTDGRGDLTGRVTAAHAIPVHGDVQLETTGSAGQRVAGYGGGLPPERMLGPGDIPVMDYGRSLGDPYSSDHYWHSGASFIYAANNYIQPAAGATCSSGGSDSNVCGAGAALRAPFLGGFTFYLGRNTLDRTTWGLGLTNSWELW